MAEAAMAGGVAAPTDIPKSSCNACARRVPWVSFWGNLSLAIYKLLIGIFGGSSALVADAMHSFADVVGSTGIVIATRISALEPDANYPYGRGKAEFLGAIFVYTVLLMFAIGIVYHAIVNMFADNLEAPHVLTLLGAVVSVLHNIFLFKYFSCVGRRNNSPAILADAFENRADAISSVACIFGIFGAMVVHPICDPIAALAVGIVIFWNCQEQLREAASGLMDRALDEDDRERIEHVLLDDEHVSKVAFLRTRQSGARYWMDIGLEVPAELTTTEADEVMNRLRQRLARSPQYHFAQFFLMPEATNESAIADERKDDDAPNADAEVSDE